MTKKSKWHQLLNLNMVLYIMLQTPVYWPHKMSIIHPSWSSSITISSYSILHPPSCITSVCHPSIRHPSITTSIILLHPPPSPQSSINPWWITTTYIVLHSSSSILHHLNLSSIHHHLHRPPSASILHPQSPSPTSSINLHQLLSLSSTTIFIIHAPSSPPSIATSVILHHHLHRPNVTQSWCIQSSVHVCNWTRRLFAHTSVNNWNKLSNEIIARFVHLIHSLSGRVK